METKLKILNRHRRGDGIRAISRDMGLSRRSCQNKKLHLESDDCMLNL